MIGLDVPCRRPVVDYQNLDLGFENAQTGLQMFTIPSSNHHPQTPLLLSLQPNFAEENRENDARNQKGHNSDASQVSNTFQPAVRCEEHSDKAGSGRRRTRHDISTGRIQKFAQGNSLRRSPGADDVNRRIDPDSKRHRNDNHVVDADFSKVKEVRKESQKT